MAYTEQTNISVSYNEQAPNAALWNNGAVEWNVVGNVETALWNVSNTTYTNTTDNTPVYAEQ